VHTVTVGSSETLAELNKLAALYASFSKVATSPAPNCVTGIIEFCNSSFAILEIGVSLPYCFSIKAGATLPKMSKPILNCSAIPTSDCLNGLGLGTKS
jgi:hypothetical protein